MTLTPTYVPGTVRYSFLQICLVSWFCYRVVHAGLQFMTLLLAPSKCWDYRCVTTPSRVLPFKSCLFIGDVSVTIGPTSQDRGENWMQWWKLVVSELSSALKRTKSQLPHWATSQSHSGPFTISVVEKIFLLLVFFLYFYLTSQQKTLDPLFRNININIYAWKQPMHLNNAKFISKACWWPHDRWT